MRRWLLGLLSVVLASVVMESAWRWTTSDVRAAPPATATTTQKTTRIGVYDPRAVAVAYAGSQANRQRLDEKQKEMDKAKAANDQAKIKELEEWGQDGQLRLHLQGFAAAPVDDLLAQVKDQLPKVAAAANVQSIGLRPDYADPGLEIVDITDDLVKLWSPDARALKTIAEIRKVAPFPIEKIAKMGPLD